MANESVRISGVRLVIEGGKEFSDGLKSASKSLKQHAAELKTLDEQYKNDGKNADYLRQRQELLTKMMADQQKRTEMLTRARDAYAKTEKVNADQLAKMNLEIEKSKQYEMQYANQLKETEKTLKSSTSAHVRLGNAMDMVKDKTDAFSKKMRMVSAAAAGLATMTVKSAIEYEDALYTLATLPQVDTSNLTEIGQDLLAGSNLTGQAAGEMVDAAYNALSAGVSLGNTAQFITEAAMAGKAGMSSVGTAVDGATSAMNAWGISYDRGREVFGKFLITQNVGKTTLNELAGSIGNVTGIAPQLGVSLDEVLSATAALTLSGVKTSEAMNGLKAVFSNVLKPTAEAAKEAKRLGLEFSSTALRSKGLTGFMADVMDKTKGDADSLAKLFGSVEGLSKIMALGTSAAGTYGEALAQMKTGGNVLEEMFDARMGSRAQRLTVSFNKLKNAGIEFGGSMAPVVDIVSNTLTQLSDWVSSMDEGMISTVAWMVGATAAAAPLAKGISGVATAIKLISALLAGPAGIAVLSGLAIGGLIAWLATAKTSTDRMNESLAALKFNVPEESKKAVTDGINDGIRAADSVHTVKVQIDTETQQLQDQQDGATEDGKVTKKEASSLTKALNAQVDADIKAAKEHVDEKKEEYKQSLLSLLDANGEAVYTEADAETIATAMTTKTKEMTAQLDATRDEYVALLKSIMKDGNTPTQEEIDHLNVLLAKIGEVRLQLNAASMEADSLARAKIDRVTRGVASEQEFGDVVGYTQETYKNNMADSQAATDHRLAVAQEKIDKYQALIDKGNLVGAGLDSAQKKITDAQAEMDAAAQAGTQEQATLTEQYNTTLMGLYDGMAKANPEAAAALAEYAKLYDQYKLFVQGLQSGEGFETEEKKGVLTSENLKKYLGLDMSKEDIDAMFADTNTYGIEIDSYLLKLKAAMEEKLKAADGVTSNPMLAYLQSMLDSGSFEGLDVTKLDGALEAAFKAVDIAQRGSGIGADIVAGVKGGIGTASDALTSEDMTKLRDAVLDKTREAFDSHSPAKVMYPIGEDIAAGLGVGMSDETAKTTLGTYAALLQSALGTKLVWAYTDGYAAGTNVVTGMSDGIKAQTEDEETLKIVAGAGAALVKAIQDKLDELELPGDDDDVQDMKDAGEDMGEAFAKGIGTGLDNKKPTVSAALLRMRSLILKGLGGITISVAITGNNTSPTVGTTANTNNKTNTAATTTTTTPTTVPAKDKGLASTVVNTNITVTVPKGSAAANSPQALAEAIATYNKNALRSVGMQG